jgi:glycosyltransferase involved in cell wall biosynthesis
VNGNSRPLTIGIDSSRASSERPSGTERYSRRIIEELLDQGADQRFRLYLNQRQPLSLPQRASTEQRLIPFPRLWTHVRLSRELALHPVDVLFIPAHVVPPVHPRATVVTIHDLGYLHEPDAHTDWSRRYLDWSTRWSVRAACHVIAISEATKNDLIERYGVPAERISVVYHGIDERFRPADAAEIARARGGLGLRAHERFILFVGTLQPRKNLVRLIEAFESIADDEPDLKLVLAGRRGWKTDEFDHTLATSRHRTRILLPGHVPDADLPALYSSATAVALISLYEGFGLPALEAMACGAPVLVSDRGSLPEVTDDAAIVVDPVDVRAISAGLRILLTPADRNRRVARGRQHASRFTWHQSGRDTLEILMNAYSPRKG